MRINRSIKVLVILALCLPVLPTVGRADVVITKLAVTPIQPLYEIVGETAVLNCEMTFDNTGWPVELVSWKVQGHYLNHGPVDFPGTLEEFWFNVRIQNLDPWEDGDVTGVYAGYFEDGVYNQGLWIIPKNRRVVFFLPHTEYPMNDVPETLTVYLKFRTKWEERPTEREIEFDIDPEFHSTDLQYIFPVGFDPNEQLGRGANWAMSDWFAQFGDIHGFGHELYAGHRRAIWWGSTMTEPVLCDQRYAHDLVIIDENGSSHAWLPSDWPKPVGIFYAWGTQVFAMADGTVRHVEKDVDDNMIAGEINFPDKKGGGNSVLIEHSNGEFSVYAHLQKSSIPDGISEGVQVTRGQVIGRVGNSGSTSEPHLHFGLFDRDSWQGVGATDSLPIRFTNIQIKKDADPLFQPWSFNLPSGVRILID